MVNGIALIALSMLLGVILSKQVYSTNFTYANFNFSVSAKETSPTALTWNGSSFFMGGISSDALTEYNKTGNFTGFNFTLTPKQTNPSGVTYKDGKFYVVKTASTVVYEYNSTGNYTEYNFSTLPITETMQGICTNGSSFFIVGDVGDSIYEYNSTGNYTGFYFNTSAQDVSPRGCEYLNGKFYVVGYSNVIVSEYNSTGNYTGYFFSTDVDATPTDITTNGSSLFVLGDTTNSIYAYNPVLTPCTAPASGNWNLEASNNCVWDTPQNIPGNLIITGTGAQKLSAKFTWTGVNQYLILFSGAEIDIFSGGEI